MTVVTVRRTLIRKMFMSDLHSIKPLTIFDVFQLYFVVIIPLTGYGELVDFFCN
jgi:hypothetical protein